MSRSTIETHWHGEPGDERGDMESYPLVSETFAAEFEDALGVLDELHVVMSRLKRLRLVDESEHHEAKQVIERISGILHRKISG